MPLQPRVIAVIQIDRYGKMVKTQQFQRPRYVGAAINAARIFYGHNAHEVCITSINGIKNMEAMHRIAKELFVPLSYGGGIKSLADASEAFSFSKGGAEKVILSEYANKELIGKLSEEFGAQAVVVSLDYNSEGWITKGKDRKIQGLNVVDAARNAKEWGAGEIILHSIERDGMWSGYDIMTLMKVMKLDLRIPIVMMGGATGPMDYKEVHKLGASGAAAGSAMCFKKKSTTVMITYKT